MQPLKGAIVDDQFGFDIIQLGHRMWLSYKRTYEFSSRIAEIVDDPLRAQIAHRTDGKSSNGMGPSESLTNVFTVNVTSASCVFASLMGYRHMSFFCSRSSMRMPEDIGK